MGLLDRLKNAWAYHRAFNAALAELEHYSDRELRELRISRADVPALAREEAALRAADALRHREQRRASRGAASAAPVSAGTGAGRS